MTDQPVIVSYGAGRDSTAMLIEMVKRNWRPDAILFANVGSEKVATYQFLPIFNQWLLAHNFPEITIVKYQPKLAPYYTLEGNMIKNATLPGAALNRHTCTLKFKVEPQNRWTRKWAPARTAWARGQKVLKLIGFECDEIYRLKRADARAHSGKADPREQERFEYQMPLMDWGINLDKCVEIIENAGLPIPPKSACYFCPNQKPWEVDEATPEDRARTMLIELVAEPYNKKVRGLWRKARKSDGRPGSITEYVLQNQLPFTPLTAFGEKVVLNPKCQKARNGVTFRPPFVGPSLREQMIAAGHPVPEVVLDETGQGTSYQEDIREASLDVETDTHAELVESL